MIIPKFPQFHIQVHFKIKWLLFITQFASAKKYFCFVRISKTTTSFPEEPHQRFWGGILPLSQDAFWTWMASLNTFISMKLFYTWEDVKTSSGKRILLHGLQGTNSLSRKNIDRWNEPWIKNYEIYAKYTAYEKIIL